MHQYVRYELPCFDSDNINRLNGGNRLGDNYAVHNQHRFMLHTREMGEMKWVFMLLHLIGRNKLPI